jgi:2-methylcitrate dehydratase PrpD
MQAKFSLQYALAVILHSGACTLSDFTPEAVKRPEVRALFDRVVTDPIDKLEGEVTTTVDVHLTSGTVLHQSLDMPLGSKAAPFTDEQYWDKFDSCVGGLMTSPQVAPLKDALNRMGGLENIGHMMKPLRTPFAEAAS